MATVELKAKVSISGENLTMRALERAWDRVWKPVEAAPLVAEELMKPLGALGFTPVRTVDLERIEFMIKGRLWHEPEERPEGELHPIFGRWYPQIAGGSAAGDYLEQKVMEHLFRNSAIFTPPANIYIALYTAATNDTNAGGTEVSGGAYARQAVGTTAGWTAPGTTGGATDNAAAIVYPTATANLGTIGWVAGQDALTVGNRFFHGALTSSKTVNSGDDYQFVTGDLDVSLA